MAAMQNTQPGLGSQNFSPIDVNQLLKWGVTPGDVYWQREQKYTLVGRAGQALDRKLLLKLADSGKELKITYHYNLPLQTHESIKSYFQIIKSNTDIQKQIEAAKSILKICINLQSPQLDNTEHYQEQPNFLDFMAIGLENFYDFDSPATEVLKDIDTRLFQRSCILSTLTVLTAMATGIIDPVFLRDLYHVIYLFDYSFVQEKLSTFVFEALEHDRVTQKGFEYLSISPQEQKLFANHADQSYRIVRKHFHKFFVNKEILNLIKTHHTQFSDSSWSIQDLEKIIMTLQKNLAYQIQNFDNNEGIEFFSDFLSLKNQNKNENQTDKNFIAHIRECIKIINGPNSMVDLYESA